MALLVTNTVMISIGIKVTAIKAAINLERMVMKNLDE
jgi:hypothetical protein